jgi:hypothetical protein
MATVALSNEAIIRTLLDARGRLAASVWLIVREAHVTEDIFQEVCAGLEQGQAVRARRADALLGAGDRPA